MSEQPNNVTSLDDYRQGSRLDDDTHIDFQKSSLAYDASEIAKVHQIEAARQAREAAMIAERSARRSGPELACEDLTRLAAVRKAVLSGQIGVAS